MLQRPHQPFACNIHFSTLPQFTFSSSKPIISGQNLANFPEIGLFPTGQSALRRDNQTPTPAVVSVYPLLQLKSLLQVIAPDLRLRCKQPKLTKLIHP
jgi:hypothetical protein